MIFDKITNIDRYRGLHPNLDLAISYIFDHAGKLPERVDISGSDVYANTFSYVTVPDNESFFEAHEAYADIQIMLSGKERVAVSNVSVLKVNENHPEKDFLALSGPEEVSIILSPETFLIVLPGDAHKLKMQLDAPSPVTKSVFKVRVK